MKDKSPRIQATINGQTCSAPGGTSILDIATNAGIEIPTLCHYSGLSSVGSCRLCVVEIAGRPGQHPACTEPITQGMCVTTESSALFESRQMTLEMLLSNYSKLDDSCDHNVVEETEFLRWVQHYKAQATSRNNPSSRFPIDADSNPFIRVDMNRCILCTRCVRACEEVQGRFVWGVADRGEETKIVAGFGTDMKNASCEFCGACSACCPTDALTDRAAFGIGKPDRLVQTTCGYCGVGCMFDLNVKDNRVVQVTSRRSAPVNGMSLCVKGRYGYEFLHHQDRLTQPKIRQYLLSNTNPRGRPKDRGPWVEVDWQVALDLVADRFIKIKHESGSNAVGFLSSAKCTNEENYLLQKLARQLFATNNIDHCARLCHSSTVTGLSMAFGSGAMSNSMDDVAQHAQAALIIGSNTTEQHPVFGAMLRQAVLRRGLKLVVADPRKIDITQFATVHLRHQPGTDVALLNGIMHLAIRNNWIDTTFIEQRCEGFEEFKTTVQEYPPRLVSEITGVPIVQLEEAAKILCTNRPMAVIWAMGITQHTTGVMNVLSLANLQMLLGNMGVPGGGVNPLRGQNNVQGACDMGALPNVFPGYQATSDTKLRAQFETAWLLRPNGKPASTQFTLPSQPGLTVTELIEAAGDATVRGLFIMGEDPVMTEPDVSHTKQSLENSEFVVLQEIFPSETAQFADVLLPGAAFAEKYGTFTNTERRVQPVRQAISPPGNALPDWKILADLGKTILAHEQLEPVGKYAPWYYENAEQVLDEIAALTPSYSGISWDRVNAGERLQWPVTAEKPTGTPILHVESFTRGKGHFHAVDYLPAKELPCEEFPLLLTTGRVLYHWHGGELTRRSPMLSVAYSQPLVEISPDDANRFALTDGKPLRLVSRRGEMIANTVVTNRVPAGVVFGSFHFPREGNVNNLTICALDPIAKIPEYKVCAVAVEPLEP